LRVRKIQSILVPLTAALFLAGSVTGTELKNIEKITPQGSEEIDITGKMDLNGKSLTDSSGTLSLEGGNVEVPNGNLAVSGNTDGVDLDNPGTAITVNSNQYEVADNSISVTELDTGSTDTRYLNRGGDAMNGDLDVSGGNINDANVVNTDLVQKAGGNADIEFAGGGRIDIRNSNNNDIIRARDNGNVDIPNGNLNVNNQLSVGSTECKTGEYIDGDGTCTSVVAETSAQYVNEGGDTMTGSLDMNNNRVGNVSKLDVSTSNTQIASFSSTGIDFKQPLSLESSGPLSVANGIELTGTSSNTLESYSTLYLETSSGSPSDIVLDPTGEVGVDSNLSVTGNIDIGSSGAIKTDGTDAISVDSNQNVEISNGNLNMNNQNIQNAKSIDVDSINSGGTEFFDWKPLETVAIGSKGKVNWSSGSLPQYDYYRIIGSTYNFGANQVQFRLNDIANTQYNYKRIEGSSISETTSDDRFRISGSGSGIIWFDYKIIARGKQNANFATNMDLSMYGRAAGVNVNPILTGRTTGANYRSTSVSSIRVLTDGGARAEFAVYGANVDTP
jgi:hypothetical protein